MAVNHHSHTVMAALRPQRCFGRWLVLACALGACIPGTNKIGGSPSWRQSGSAQEPTAPAPIDPNAPILVFAPTDAATTHYNQATVAPIPSTPLGDAVVAAINQIAATKAEEPPRPDARLYKAAAELATVAPEDAPLPYPLIEFALQRNGIIEPSPHLVVIWGPVEDAASIMEQLGPRLPDILASGKYTRVGVGTARRGLQGVAILALQESNLVTKPIPRELPAGGTIVLEGAIGPSFRKPEVYVTHDGGSVEEPKIKASKTGEFYTEVSCAGRRGLQQVEITAVDDSGSTVLANFPVWCNERAPTSLSVPLPVDNVALNTPEQAQDFMLELVNRDRERYKLPPLALDPNVSAVALAHSQEMQSTGVVAHISPTTGSAADRVKQAGIRTALVLENVARAYGVTEAQAGLMNSPGHRSNILSSLATHVGIGVVFGETVAGRREVFVTQVFTRVPPNMSVAEARRRLVEMIAEEAKKSGNKLPKQDERLSKSAQEYADALAAGHPADKTWAPIRPKLAQEVNRFSHVTLSLTSVIDIEAFGADELFKGRTISHYGLGMSKGKNSDGEDAFFVVMLLALQR